MKFYPVISLIAAVTCFIFSISVLLKSKRNKQSRAFCFATVLTGIWTLFPFLSSLPEDNYAALDIARFLYFFASFVPTAWYYFLLSILGSKKEKVTLIIFFCFSIFFGFISLTPLLIKDIIRFAPNFSPTRGRLYFLFIIFFGIVFADIFRKIYAAIEKARGNRRKQLIYISWAYFIGALSGLIHFISSYTLREPFPHDILIILYPCILSYAILKYRFMDIQITITRTGVFVAVYSIVLGLPFVAATAGRYWLIKFLGVNWWAGSLVLMAILATVGPFLYIYLHKRAEAILLREQREYQETLKQSSMGISRIRNLKQLLSFITNIIVETVRISHAAVYLFDPQNQSFILKSGCNLKENQPESIDKRNLLLVWLTNQREPLVYEEVKQKSENEYNPVFKEMEEEMRALNASVILGSFLEDNLIDIVILGSKYSGKSYTLEDLGIFSVLANEAALAIENALLYENMEEKIKLRTEELVAVQRQLIHTEKLATIGTLAGGVAHEINNPLTAILTNAQMLLSDGESMNEESRESLQLIEEATKRCRNIVQKLMTYAKKPLEHKELSRINLSDAVKSAVALLSYQFEQDNVKIITRADAGDISIMGNQSEIEQVVTNLLINAKDAIKQIKNSGTVNIFVFMNEHSTGIEVKDEGIGIPKEILPKIFDPFFTTKDVGKGTGLGLSICQSIVEKHSGRIYVHSERGKGTVFTVRFPRINDRSAFDTSAGTK